ncbi:IS66 family transposase [Archangium lansingense]|uniref:IS66 family transposase n=1 Tax=Archangium lansingense TaxID=2995310 RepID=UPI003B799219
MQLRLQELERQLAQRTGELFGRSSEKRPQREQDEGNKPEPPTHGHGPRAQPTLPALEVEHTLEESDKQCPKCGGTLAEMKGEILGGDETRWHAWALCAPDAVVYRIQEGRDTEAARNMLQDFGGILMVDGLSTYESPGES